MTFQTTRPLLRGSVLALVIVLGTSCAVLGGLRFEKPTVQLEAIQILGLDLVGGRLALVLDVYNPNSYDLRGLGLEAELTLEDTRFGNAVLDRGFTLTSSEHTQLEVPMTFTWEGVGAGARALLTRGEVNYDLATLIRADTPAGERPVRVRLDGTVALADMVR